MYVVGGIILAFCVIAFLASLVKDVPAVPKTRNQTTKSIARAPSALHTRQTQRPSRHRWLCYAFYAMGWISLAGWLVFVFFETDGSAADARNSAIRFVAGLGCLAVGRLIEVLQNIDDELYRKRLSE